MEYHFYSSIQEFPDTLLDLLNDAPLFMQPVYLRALESGIPKGLSVRYVTYRDDKKNYYFYQFQLVKLESRNIRRIFYHQQYSKLLAHFSSLMTSYIFGVKEEKPHYLLICGSAMISGPYYGWTIPKNQHRLLENLSNAVKYISEILERDSKIVATVLKDFALADKVNVPRGFSKVMMDPVMGFNIHSEWDTMEDYVSDLSAKYRLRYKNADKKFKDIEVRYLDRQTIVEEMEQINILYQNVQLRAPIRLIFPAAEYLLSVSSMELPGSFLKAFYYKDRMIMFMCGILRNGHLEAHHIGMDYSLNRSHQLYVNLLYHFIREGIERKANHISFGRTALEIKSTVGAEPTYMNAWIKMGNHLLNKVMGPFFPSKPSTDWVQRNPFKDEG